MNDARQFYFFSDTIANNIAVNSDETDEEQMRNAAQMARIDDFVEYVHASLGFCAYSATITYME